MTMDDDSGSGGRSTPHGRTSVAIVGICGADEVRRCLTAVTAQVPAPPAEIVVAYDPRLTDMEQLEAEFPDVVWHANRGQETPLELAAVALGASTGDVVALTEDHCVPAPDWLQGLTGGLSPGRAAVGGVVEVEERADAVEWAFYFVDFFRYAPPVRPGPSRSLTVCNVAYRRKHLEAIRGAWSDFFHETAVNAALARRFGRLWITDRARVRMLRRVRLADALAERYAFGRLFGATRTRFMPGWRRWLYAALAPGLPVLLLGRMARKAARRGLRRRFARALPALVAMVLAWTLGEWLGYVTARRPEDLSAAPSRTATRS